MGVFITPKTTIATVSGDPNLSNSPNTIIEAIEHSIMVTEISVCNIGDQPIRLNLQFQQLIGGTPTTSVPAYRLKNVLINPNGTINLMNLLVSQTSPAVAGEGILLEGDPTTETTSRLILFTNGYSQVCNCTVGYSILVETPWGGPCG